MHKFSVHWCTGPAAAAVAFGDKCDEGVAPPLPCAEKDADERKLEVSGADWEVTRSGAAEDVTDDELGVGWRWDMDAAKGVFCSAMSLR